MKTAWLFHKNNILIVFTVTIMLICTICISIFSGYYHDSAKIRSIMLNTFLVILLLFVVSDTIMFLLKSIDAAWWPRPQAEFFVDEDATTHQRKDFLKMRINTLRSQMHFMDEHRNEKLNLMYQHNAKDLWLYGKYFLLLMCLVLLMQNDLFYFNTKFMKTLFFNNQTYSRGLSSVRTIHDVYVFLESAIVAAFNPDPIENGTVHWIYGDHTAKLGVTRVRQLRRKENFHMGWDDPKFSNTDYMENWVLPYERVPYTDKYWKIFEPWLPLNPKQTSSEKMLLNFDHEGYCHEYPELYGYVTTLARSYNNSMKVIEYLKEKNWLNRNTSAVFIDFTLFNTDAKLFTICTLRVERTPFGTIVPGIHIFTINLLFMQELSTVNLIILCIYISVLIEFSKALIVTLWFEPYKLRSTWNQLDVIIIALNYTVIILVIISEITVMNLLKQVEGSSKLRFLDFRLPTRLLMFTYKMIAFLICLTTLRLWRVLKFSSVFQMFADTLYSAWKALANTAVLIMIFLIAYGMAAVIINGNNAGTFNKLLHSIISSLSFSFGFHKHIEPHDLFYGGTVMGLLLYVILAFVVVQLLINLFPSTINDYFTRTKFLRDNKKVNNINFLQFLWAEYAHKIMFLQKLPCFNRAYKRQNRTVAENVKRRLDDMVRSSNKSRYKALSTSAYSKRPTLSDKDKHNDYKQRIERLFTIAAIMQTQIELLDHLLITEEVRFATMESDTDSDYDY